MFCVVASLVMDEAYQTCLVKKWLKTTWWLHLSQGAVAELSQLGA